MEAGQTSPIVNDEGAEELIILTTGKISLPDVHDLLLLP